MTAKLAPFVVCWFAFSISASAQQVDAASLRAKYGKPLDEEVFQVRNMEMVVTYGAGRRVCRIEFPLSATRQQVGEVIDDLAPPRVRGKETKREVLTNSRGHSISYVSYEHLTIIEPEDGVIGLMMIFNRPDCLVTVE
jgi:hypothetical protein